MRRYTSENLLCNALNYTIAALFTHFWGGELEKMGTIIWVITQVVILK